MTEPITNIKQAVRVQSVDVLRGAVMVLMAIDHVRVYSGMPAGGPEPGIFFTRWITHYCVPVFVFLAGTSAFLYGQKINDRPKLSNFLFTRGLLLVVLELTLIRFGWTFNFDYAQFTLAGVIWMLGWCMVLMSFIVRMRIRVIWITGLAMVLFQQVFRLVPHIFPEGSRAHFSWFWEFFYSSGFEGPTTISILYVLLPWIGVMMAGYGFGLILNYEPEKRRKCCLKIGLYCILMYLLIGSLLIYFNPGGDMPFLFRLLNQQKYPPSQLYLLMTLGPAVALVPFVERARGWFTNVLSIFGRVPFFYYLLHIPLIHIFALALNFIREGDMHQEWYATAPYAQVPEEHRWGLGLLYLVFILVVAVLFLICRWYAGYKAAHPEKGWLKYI